MDPSLDRALRMKSADRIAFTGAGGKTTALFQLARSLPPPVLVTATSHLGLWQVGNADQHGLQLTRLPHWKCWNMD